MDCKLNQFLLQNGKLSESSMTRDCFLLLCKRMGTYRVLEACWSTVVVYLLCAPIILVVQGAQRAALSIAFTETPPLITSRTSATFRFDILGANGSDPCGQLHCSIRCKVSKFYQATMECSHGLGSMFGEKDLTAHIHKPVRGLIQSNPKKLDGALVMLQMP